MWASPALTSRATSRGGSRGGPSMSMEAPMSSPDMSLGARPPVEVSPDGCVAVVNAGSSSVKFAIYGTGGKGPAQYRGKIEGVGVAPKLTVQASDGRTAAERSWGAEDLDVR